MLPKLLLGNNGQLFCRLKVADSASSEVSSALILPTVPQLAHSSKRGRNVEHKSDLAGRKKHQQEARCVLRNT